MYINIMRYRTGKFGVSAVETSKNGKQVNKPFEITQLKTVFGATCIEYRQDVKDGITHWWSFNTMTGITIALDKVPFPSTDNEDPEN